MKEMAMHQKPTEPRTVLLGPESSLRHPASKMPAPGPAATKKWTLPTVWMSLEAAPSPLKPEDENTGRLTPWLQPGEILRPWTSAPWRPRDSKPYVYGDILVSDGRRRQRLIQIIKSTLQANKAEQESWLTGSHCVTCDWEVSRILPVAWVLGVKR